ncbi:MAG: wax ester/triacylglycerol synthase family O-acyltransferase [Mycobacteriaceae bacterium]
MIDRLSVLDASFLFSERGRTPAHVGSLSIFAPPKAGFDYDTLVALIEQRLEQVPRYRQKVRAVPGGIARPVWVDDNDFDISFHVRRSALPAPGDDAQLHELVARLMSRRLDRSRPLWEVYLVEGLREGRVAVIVKTHQAVVDGAEALSLLQVILDDTQNLHCGRSELWMPQVEPAAGKLLVDVLTAAVHRPVEIIDSVRWVARDGTAAMQTVADSVGSGANHLKRLLRLTTAPLSPLNVSISRQRRFAVARTPLVDYRTVRAAQGGTINDVILAVVSGALRGWLLARGESLTATSTVRALTPVVAQSDAGDPSSALGTQGGEVCSLLVDLPVGEPDPLLRLARVSQATEEQTRSQRLVGAGALTRLSGFAPPTLHAMGARVADTVARRSFNVLVTNVPGPQHPLYAAGARMLEIFPVVPLSVKQALTVGVTSYDGRVSYGLNADRDAVADLPALAGLIEESLHELVQVSAREGKPHAGVRAGNHRHARRPPG